MREIFINGLAEFLLKDLIQVGVFLFVTLAIVNKKVDRREVVLWSAVISALFVMIKNLPINNGIEIIIEFALLNSLLVMYFKVDFKDSINTMALLMLIKFFCEALNVIAVILIYGDIKLNYIKTDKIQSLIYFLPATLLMMLIAVFIRLGVSHSNRKRLRRIQGDDHFDIHVEE